MSTEAKNPIDLSTIDWKQFNVQKASLVDILYHRLFPEDQQESLQGILNLMDYLQDCWDMEPRLFRKMYADANKKPGLKFVCPSCGGTELEEVCDTDGLFNPITRLDPESNFDFGPSRGGDDTQVSNYQCAGCDYVPSMNEGRDDEYTINDCVELVTWLKAQSYNLKLKKQRATACQKKPKQK